MNISEQLKKYRKEHNISQEELAEQLNVSRQTISNWENNKSYPDMQSLSLLNSHLKLPLLKNNIEVEKSMKKFEYKCVFIIGLGDKTTRVMNEYGSQGWEFVNSSWCWHYFKRELN